MAYARALFDTNGNRIELESAFLIYKKVSEKFGQVSSSSLRALCSNKKALWFREHLESFNGLKQRLFEESKFLNLEVFNKIKL